MWARFKNLDKNDKGYLERGDMLRIPELAINPLGDRIVHAFFTLVIVAREISLDLARYSGSPAKSSGKEFTSSVIFNTKIKSRACPVRLDGPRNSFLAFGRFSEFFSQYVGFA